ncbi:MAG: Fur family transcriptional regulator [Mariprofundaceae bacterium]|nr:Fur family transcriptional regulator [Mariprofundaceae bacterium]
MTIRLTPQRQAILALINGSSSHWDAETVLAAMKSTGKSIGIATVYRALAALEAAALIDSMFIGERKCYERMDKHHHDHLLCTVCGGIEEFFQPQIEELQAKIAHEHGFMMKSHSLILQGICQQCQQPEDCLKIKGLT